MNEKIELSSVLTWHQSLMFNTTINKEEKAITIHFSSLFSENVHVLLSMHGAEVTTVQHSSVETTG